LWLGDYAVQRLAVADPSRDFSGRFAQSTQAWLQRFDAILARGVSFFGHVFAL
jgi:hypothetical protein